MIDPFNRKITYLRISVTDKCNFRCVYCMPAEGIPLINHQDILSFEEIVETVSVGAGLGIRKIRLTGGEPLIRKGIVDLVGMINEIDGIEEITMTTNGILLPRFAGELKSAGLKRVNISLDTLDPEQFKAFSRVGHLEDVLKGIYSAIVEGLNPVKINVVKLKDVKNQDIGAIRSFCNDLGIGIRVIDEMDLETGSFSIVDGGEGGNCKICNRLRLTANGDIKPCLFSNTSYNIRKYGATNAFRLALENKPEFGVMSTEHTFYSIGG